MKKIPDRTIENGDKSTTPDHQRETFVDYFSN